MAAHYDVDASAAFLSEGCECLVLKVRRAARAITDFYDLVLAPAGLRITQFILLRAIAHHGKVSQHELVQELAVAPETMSRRLSSLRSAGWIRLEHPQNGREHFYRITENGRRQLLQALPFWRRSQKRLRQCLREENWTLAFDLMDSLAIAAHHAETARLTNTI